MLTVYIADNFEAVYQNGKLLMAGECLEAAQIIEALGGKVRYADGFWRLKRGTWPQKEEDVEVER